MTAAHIAGYAILAVVFIGVYVAMVLNFATIFGIKRALIEVSTVWCGVIVLVTVLLFAMALIKS